MSKQIYISIAVLAGAAALATFIYRSEPAYQGKSLSDWIVAMNTASEPENRQKARAAVHRLGTNSIPVLLEWLQRPDRPSLKERLSQPGLAALGWMERHRFIAPKPRFYRLNPKGSYRALALAAFEELGPDGKAAIPPLIQWLGRRASTTNDLDETAGAAFLVLQKLSPASIPALTAALSSPDDQVWALAAATLGNIGPTASAAIPALRPRLRGPNPLTRVAAADVIGRLGGDPEEFMPVLIQALREPDMEMLGYKLDVLLRYKEHAGKALPVLQDILRSLPDSGSPADRARREHLTNAIGQIQHVAAPTPK